MKSYPNERLTMLARRKSRALEAILSMESEVLTDDLANGHRDLIALYASLIADFAGFMQWQIWQAAAAGATREQLRESVRLGADLSDNKGFVSSILAVVTQNIVPVKDKVEPNGSPSG